MLTNGNVTANDELERRRKGRWLIKMILTEAFSWMG